MYASGSKSFASPPIVVSRPAVSKRVIGPMPLRPASMPSQVFVTESPSGVIMPRPVTTTRRRSPLRMDSSLRARGVGDADAVEARAGRMHVVVVERAEHHRSSFSGDAPPTPALDDRGVL